MSNFLFYLGAFALALGLLIVVHEAGHFALARWCGVKVLRFSIGFGKPVLSHRFGRDQTELALAAFPLGGYVKMLDEREGEVEAAELPRAFNRQPVLKRFAIVLAGPVSNFMLAILMYWVLFVHGVEEPRPVLGAPAAQSMVDMLVVEGVGGFCVPLNEHEDTADMAVALGLPVVLVVGVRLGCLSHALLTAEAIRTRGLTLAGWVANHIEPGMLGAAENVLTLRERLGVPLISEVSFSAFADFRVVAGLLDYDRLCENN